MSQLEALEVQLKAYRASDLWAAEVEMCRGIAKALDLAEFDAYMWREYRQALKALREVLRDDSGGQDVEDLDAQWDAIGRSDIRDSEESGPGD